MTSIEIQVQTLEQQLFNLQRAVEALTQEMIEMRLELNEINK